MNIRIPFIVFVALFPAFAGSAPASTGRFTVTFQPDFSTARVTGKVHPGDGRLHLNSRVSWGLKGGDWREWIRDLKVTDARGVEIRASHDSAGGWTLAGNAKDSVFLAYTIDLGYARTATTLPRTTTGFVDSSGLYTITAPLFLTGSGDSTFTVSVNAPSGWHITTAWEQSGTSGRNFNVASAESLTENALVVSRAESARLSQSGFDVRVALLGDRRSLSPVVKSVVSAQLSAALGMLPNPGPTRHLLVFFPDERWDSGEALEASNVMSSQQAPELENVSLWGKTLAHELIHLWNGHMIGGTDWAASQWFSEGTTEYLADLAQYRAGVIDETTFLNHMRKHLHLYLLFEEHSVHEDLSLVEAGSKKAKNNAAIYDGGALAAFCFDGMIREQTRGSRELSDVLRALIERAGSDGYSNEEIVTEIVALAGDSAREVYDSAVAGRRKLPLLNCFSRYGYHLGTSAQSVELHPESNPPAVARLMRMSLGSKERIQW